MKITRRYNFNRSRGIDISVATGGKEEDPALPDISRFTYMYYLMLSRPTSYHHRHEYNSSVELLLGYRHFPQTFYPSLDRKIIENRFQTAIYYSLPLN